MHYALRLWDVKTGKEVGARDGNTCPVGNVAFTPDGRVVTWDGFSLYYAAVRLWDTTGKQLAVVSADDWMQCVALSPDGKTVAFGQHDGTVRFKELATNKETARFSADEPGHEPHPPGTRHPGGAPVPAQD